jgi:parallel beta-helix repeat protein
MKTLGQVEPRIAITNIPLTISAPGSYYLTTNLTGTAGQNGITITTDDVTIDLNGFTLTGGASGPSNGIFADVLRENLLVRNGVVRGWPGDGIKFQAVRNCWLVDVGVYSNGMFGVNSGQSIMERCVGAFNSVGFITGAGSVFRDCTAFSNTGTGIAADKGSIVMGCSAYDNGSGGISVTQGGQVSQCAAYRNSGNGIAAGDGSTVTDCSSYDNVFSGFSIGRYSTIKNCTAYSNDLSLGIFAGLGCTVESCTVNNNGLDGIRVAEGCTVRACTSRSNKGDGIEADDDCLVVGNLCDDNGLTTNDGAGIHVTGQGARIEQNTVLDADRGLDIDQGGNYVAGNRVQGNTDNYDIAAGNHLNLLLSELPESIDWPANVKPAGTLTGQSASAGITINADDVTIDLDGHALVGVTGTLEGIVVPAAQKNIEIRNGTVRSWGRHGVDALNANNSILMSLRAFTNGWESTFQDGLRVGENSLVRLCVGEANQYNGIYAGSGCTVSECTTRSNGADGIKTQSGCTVSECTARSNGADGINTQSGCTVSKCTARSNGADGISGGPRNTVSECTATDNGAGGIRLFNVGRVSECTAVDNGAFGILALSGSTVIACMASSNDGNGISVSTGNTVSECTASFNTGDGIEVASDSRVANNTCAGNGSANGSGIHATGSDNRIEGNTLTNADRGIDVGGSGNLIIRNSASGNGTNYVIAASNRYGPIIDITAGGSAAVNGSGAADTSATTHPWANFSF